MKIESVKSISAEAYRSDVRPVQITPVEAPRQTAQERIQLDTSAHTEDNNSNNSGNNSREMTNEQIRKAVSDINKKMDNTSCQFGIHDETNRVTIKIIDKDTKEVVKEFPPEETLDLIAKAWELAGIMVDKRL